MNGYYWVAGQWQWSGYEWIWQPVTTSLTRTTGRRTTTQGTYDNGTYYYDSSYSQPTISGGIYFNSGY